MGGPLNWSELVVARDKTSPQTTLGKMGIYYMETEASKGRVKTWSKRQGVHIPGAHYLSSPCSLANSFLHSLLSPPHGEQHVIYIYLSFTSWRFLYLRRLAGFFLFFVFSILAWKIPRKNSGRPGSAQIQSQWPRKNVVPLIVRRDGSQ